MPKKRQLKPRTNQMFLLGFVLVTVGIIMVWKIAFAAGTLNYLALGDSIPQTTPGYVSAYKQHIENDLSKQVNLNNLAHFGWGSSQILDKLKNDSVYKSAVAQANIITLSVGINDFLYGANLFEQGNTCGSPEADGCLASTTSGFNTNLNQIVSEIKELNTSQATIIRFIDIHHIKLNEYTQAGNFTLYKSHIDQMNNHLYQIASTNNIQVALVNEIINGPTRDLDGFENGYLLEDNIHLNTAGYTMVADKLQELGYGPLGEDSDEDGVPDLLDNCPNAPNLDQANYNKQSISLNGYTFSDITNANGDAQGDACSVDDDADGLTDTEESALGTNSLERDTDQDGQTDKFENLCGSNPLDAASKVTNNLPDADNDGISNNCEASFGTDQNNRDSDGDTISDSTELRHLATNALNSDTDNDGCADRIEIASVNNDKVVNVADRGLVSSKNGTKIGNANYIRNFDINGDGSINVADVGIVASLHGQNCN